MDHPDTKVIGIMPVLLCGGHFSRDFLFRLMLKSFTAANAPKCHLFVCVFVFLLARPIKI